MLPIFFIKFQFPCSLVCKPLRKHALPDQTRAGFLFNLIRNPRGYQYIDISPFPDSFRFAKSYTNPKHHRDWKTQTSSTKYCSRPRLFFLLFHSRNSKLKNRTASWAGEFFDRITFFAVYPTTICNTTWMNVCPNLVSAIDSSKQKKKKKKNLLFHENTNSKKKNLESI